MYAELLERFCRAFNITIKWEQYSRYNIPIVSTDPYTLSIYDTVRYSAFIIQNYKRSDDCAKQYVDITHIETSTKSYEECCEEIINKSLNNRWTCCNDNRYKLIWSDSIEELDLNLSIIMF